MICTEASSQAEQDKCPGAQPGVGAGGWSLKSDRDELVYKTEIDPRHRKQAYWVTKGERGPEGEIRSLGLT